jgi:hypothetical protein
LAPCKESVKWYSGVMMSVRGEVGDNVGWVTQILLGQKIKKKSRDQFSCYNWTVKI